MRSAPLSDRQRIYGRILLALVIGLAIGYLRVWLSFKTQSGADDFFYALRIIRDLWQGNDPYAYASRPDLVSFPLPAGFLAAPFAALPDEWAAGAFMGLSGGLLAWLLLGRKTFWPLLIFLSWPFAYALLFAQFSPLIACIWFVPSLSPLILVKPHMALPLILTSKVSWKGLVVTALVLIASLLIYPTWPFVWLGKIGTYKGAPPLFSLPLGPILLLALLKVRDRRAWLLFLLALMPQRVIYDQLALLLVAGSALELSFLVFCSWLALPVLLSSGGWVHMPINWQFWIVLTLYLPALIVLFLPDIKSLLRRISRKTNGSADAAGT